MPASPASYRWIRDSALGEAACITVIPSGRDDLVRLAYGAHNDVLSTTPMSSAEFWDVDLGSFWAWFVRPSGTAHAAVVEQDGFQGSRPEVIRVASKGSAVGKAASAYWNVNGIVVFTYARKGKLVDSIDLSAIDSDEGTLRRLPRGLRRLALAAASEQGDGLPCIALAMVEEFTGVEFGVGDLDSGEVRAISPVPNDVTTYDADYLPVKLRDHPELSELLLEIGPERQRMVSKAATRIAVAEAGLTCEPGVAEVLRQFDDVEVPTANPALGALDGAVARRNNELMMQSIDTGRYGSVEIRHLYQQASAISAVQQSTNPNALSSALACCSAAIVAASCAHLERGLKLLRDNSGGRVVPDGDPTAARTAAVVEVLTSLARSDPATWTSILERLPSPLTTAQREAAVAEDRRREEAGEFDEYKIVES